MHANTLTPKSGRHQGGPQFSIGAFMKHFLAIASLLLCAGMIQAQAPPSLPGFGVSMSAGYTSVSGQPLGNGLFASFAAPVYTNPGFASGPLKNDAFTVA